MEWLKKILGAKEPAPPPPPPPPVPAPAPVKKSPASPGGTTTKVRSSKPKAVEATRSRKKETEVTGAKDAKAYFVRAMTRKEKGRLDDAEADLNKVLQLNPKVAQAHFERGVIRQALGKVDEAIADFTKALELKPDYAAAYSTRGVLRERKGDTAGAKADYSKSIDIEFRAALAREYPGFKPNP